MTSAIILPRRAILGGLASTLALSACSVSYTAPEADLPERFASDSPARRAGANAW